MRGCWERTLLVDLDEVHGCEGAAGALRDLLEDAHVKIWWVLRRQPLQGRRASSANPVNPTLPRGARVHCMARGSRADRARMARDAVQSSLHLDIGRKVMGPTAKSLLLKLLEFTAPWPTT